MSGTTGTVRTVSDLLTLFEDGQSPGSITPKDVRDLIVSLQSLTSTALETALPSADTSHLYAGTGAAGGAQAATVDQTLMLSNGVLSTPSVIYRARPGNPSSPWNYALNSSNTYGGTNVFSALSGGLSSWSGNSYPIWYAQTTDPVVKLLYCSTAQSNTSSGTWAHTGNSTTIETAIRAASTTTFPATPNGAASRFNYQSTSSSSWVLPTSLAVVPNLPSGYPYQVYRPTNAVPCNDTDGHMIVYQPDGMVLETYATIILSDGTIVCGNWNLTDPSGLVDGYAGGVTASCLPNYAGLIRQAELTAGSINHALALAIPAAQLAKSIVYPAVTFDRSTTYSGTFGMGTRFAIPASVNLATVRTWESTEGPMIAHAAQTYGCYAVDTGGGGITIRCEAGITNPEFVDAPGSPDYNLYDDVTWIVHNLQQVTA